MPEPLLADIVLGARGWVLPATALAIGALAAILWSYQNSRAAMWLKATCAALKIIAVLLIAVCLVEPLFTGTRPRPGSNLFLVLADNSRSLQLADRGSGQSRGEIMRAELQEENGWLTRLAQDYDLRRYTFDAGLHPVQDYAELSLDGEAATASPANRSPAFSSSPMAMRPTSWPTLPIGKVCRLSIPLPLPPNPSPSTSR